MLTTATLKASAALATLLLLGGGVSFTAAAPAAVSNATLKRDYNVNVGWPYGQQKIRGVNIGGWLVLEPWITPDLFDAVDGSIVDQWTFSQNQDRGAATRALQNHWNTFITEDDFRQIAAAGLNHVRIPIGYWDIIPLQGEPYITGAKQYLYNAIGWARNHGLKVLIDLHGAPGSQNGYDNSGHRGSANWATSQDNLSRSKAAIQSLAQEFSDPQYYGVVTALEILNEPAGYLNGQLLSAARQFNIDGYYTARYPWAQQGSGSQSGLLIVYHDAFQSSSYWNGVFVYPKAADVALDHHHYQCFSQGDVSQNWGQHLTEACNEAGNLQQAPNWPFVGEWSLATHDCAKYLNGRGVGARYDGSYPGSSYVGSCSYYNGQVSNASPAYRQFLRDFWDTQTQTYENNGQGWIFWNWKAPEIEWSYQQLVNNGIVPTDPTQHQGYKCS